MTEAEVNKRDEEFMNLKLEKLKTPSHLQCITMHCTYETMFGPNNCYICTETEHK